LPCSSCWSSHTQVLTHTCPPLPLSCPTTRIPLILNTLCCLLATNGLGCPATQDTFFSFFLWYWGLNSGPSPWATPLALFLWRVFRDRIPQLFCSGWLWTATLLISAFWVARIKGMGHWCPTQDHFFW
jgi:hypothetical protein